VEEDANLGSWSWQVKSNCGKTFDVEGMPSNLEFKERYDL
jgi:hypothetical protein